MFSALQATAQANSEAVMKIASVPCVKNENSHLNQNIVIVITPQYWNVAAYTFGFFNIVLLQSYVTSATIYLSLF